MKLRPTPPPRTPPLVRRRVARSAIGAGAIAAGLVVACGGKTTADDGQTIIAPQVAPQPPQENCGDPTRHCIPPQLPPQDVAPQPPPPQPPQPFDAGVFDADDGDGGTDAG